MDTLGVVVVLARDFDNICWHWGSVIFAGIVVSLFVVAFFCDFPMDNEPDTEREEMRRNGLL